MLEKPSPWLYVVMGVEGLKLTNGVGRSSAGGASRKVYRGAGEGEEISGVKMEKVGGVISSSRIVVIRVGDDRRVGRSGGEGGHC